MFLEGSYSSLLRAGSSWMVSSDLSLGSCLALREGDPAGGAGSCGNSEILGECWDQSPGPKAAMAGLGRSPQTCPCSCLTLPHGWPAPMPPERIVLTFFQMITEVLETCHQQHRNVTITSVRPPPPRPHPQSQRSSYLFCPLHPGCILSHRHGPLT